MIFVVAYFYFLFLALRNVLWGGIPFWSDPARDLLLAWDNLNKISLIGPPGGIPGVFYGPYWLWLNSLILIFTKDPRFCALFIILLPYFTLFPWLFWKLKMPIVWLLFMLAYGASYTTFIWQPYLVPILLLLLAYLCGRDVLHRPFLTGIIAAMLVNFHLSFGIVSCLFMSFYFFVRWLVKDRKIKTLALYVFGVVLVFLPFLVFETRHGFNQVRSFLAAFINASIFNSASVGQTGLTRAEILDRFLSIPANFLQIPKNLVIFVWAALLVTSVRKVFSQAEKNFLLFLVFMIAGLFLVFYTSKNPVWDYYFIGVETLFLLLIGVLVNKSKVLTAILFLWILVLLGKHIGNFIKDPGADFLAVPSLASKQQAAEVVLTDAGSNSFTVYAYSPSIYSYEYNYLFRWLGPKNINQDPTFVYLIIPETSLAVKEDFIHYKTPDNKYETVWEKNLRDKTSIIKRKII